MFIGIIGAPNKGKSTLFSALTLIDVKIAYYPFTTIDPNIGIAYLTKQCVEKELGVRCNPRNSACVNGIRCIPVNIVDIAGLVPGAHMGKGMGSQFLNDLIGADVLIQVVDISGKTDINGNPAESADPSLDVAVVRDEMARWLAGIISKHIGTISKRNDGAEALKELLSGFKASTEEIKDAADSAGLSTTYIAWNKDMLYKFSEALLSRNKPVIVAANKLDKSDDKKLKELEAKLKGYKVVGCSSAIELALRKAAKKGDIEYIQGSSDFVIKGRLTGEQEKALDYMKGYLAAHKSTGIQELIDTAVFELGDRIAVYPVESETEYTDHGGNVLPDVLLIKEGSTAQGLASMIHTDLAARMLYAIDVRNKKRIGKDHILKDNDVIKIVSAAR